MWERKFDLTRSGCVVSAEYAKERTYRLRFETTNEAELFVEKFKSAQQEIAENEKLKTMISIAVSTSNRSMKITFVDSVSSLRINCKMDDIGELCSFYNRLHAQITQYAP